jgi:flagellar basal body-associated protein FliL
MKSTRVQSVVKNKKALIGGVIGLVVIVALGYGAYVFSQGNGFVGQTKKDVTEEEYPYPEGLSYEEDANTITFGYEQGSDKESLDEAQAKLDEAEKNGANDDEKEAYALKSVELLQLADKPKEALQEAIRVDTTYASASTAATIAALYNSTGNYKQAAKYYGLAAARSSKTDDPSVRSAYNDYKGSEEQMKAKL